MPKYSKTRILEIDCCFFSFAGNLAGITGCPSVMIILRLPATYISNAGAK